MDNPLLLTPEQTAVLCQQNKAVGSMIITGILVFIAIITVSLRLYVCIALRRTTGWDDYFIVASLVSIETCPNEVVALLVKEDFLIHLKVSGLVAFGLFSKLFASGMGRHVFCLTLAQVSETAKWSLFSQIFISISLGLTKVSVCLFVLRIIDQAHRRFSQFLWVLIAFVTVTHVVQLVLFLVQCRPLEAVWNPFVPGHCFSINAVYLVSYINYGLDCLSDFVCAGIPIYVIRRLQMNAQTKVALCILMGLGVFTAVCVLVDAITLRGVFDHDFTWGITTPAMWAGIGAFVGITIASLPALKRLFTLPDSIKSLFSRSRTRTRSSNQAFCQIHEEGKAVQVQGSDPKYRIDDPEQAIPSSHSDGSRTTDVTVAPGPDSEVPQGGTFYVAQTARSQPER